ncbi:hypothetical protein ACVWXQ_000987 [Bradyrhizobium sp. S3.14.4]
MIRKNQRIETLRDAFAKAATANDPEAMQLVGRELLDKYDQQPKLSKFHQDHRTIVAGMLITLMANGEAETGWQLRPDVAGGARAAAARPGPRGH